MPRAEVVAVETEPGGARVAAEIVEIRRGARRDVLVIAGAGPHPRLVPAPGRIETAGELRGVAVQVSGIAGDEDGPVDLVKQPARLLGVAAAVVVAVADVARPDEDRRLPRHRSRRGWSRLERLRSRTGCGCRRRAHRRGTAAGDCGGCRDDQQPCSSTPRPTVSALGVPACGATTEDVTGHRLTEDDAQLPRGAQRSFPARWDGAGMHRRPNAAGVPACAAVAGRRKPDSLRKNYGLKSSLWPRRRCRDAARGV